MILFNRIEFTIIWTNNLFIFLSLLWQDTTNFALQMYFFNFNQIQNEYQNIINYIYTHI